MIKEVNTAKEFLIKKFGDLKKVQPGSYIIPIGRKKMIVIIDAEMNMSGFNIM